MKTQNMTHETQVPAGLTVRVPDMARILIVSESDSDTERLTDRLPGRGIDFGKRQ